jgi:ribosomal protein L32E
VTHAGRMREEENFGRRLSKNDTHCSRMEKQGVQLWGNQVGEQRRASVTTLVSFPGHRRPWKSRHCHPSKRRELFAQNPTHLKNLHQRHCERHSNITMTKLPYTEGAGEE